MSSKLLSSISAFVVLFSSVANALPPDFQITQFAGGLRDPATMAFAPDGRLFVGERITGKLRIITESGQILPTPFLTLDVPPVRHRSGGVRGFAFDPNFPAEPYLYIFYTKQFAGDVRHNRVSRFTVSAGDPNIGDPTSELVLLEMPFNSHALGSSGSHNGGAVVFGGDGKLYIATGDGWNASNGYGAGDNVQSLTSFTGKLFRINRDGTIPPDNPFLPSAVYALGFRNPSAATTHPVTGEVFVFDVGTANGSNKDHVFRVAAGDNFGHDGYGGIGTQKSTWAKAGAQIVSGGVWYFADQFPAAYREQLFVTSWKKGLKTMTLGGTVAEFGSNDVDDQGPLFPCVGPDGSLYFLNSTYETSDGRVYKLSYTNINRADTPNIAPNGGQFSDQASVTLSSATAGAAIHYTLDGGDPDETSPLYSAPVLLTTSATLKARALAAGFDPSPVASAVFDIVQSTPPQFSNSIPNTAQLAQALIHQAEAIGLPSATFSLDTAPSGMTVNGTTGELFWLPNAPGDFTVTLRASNGVPPDAVQTVTVSVGNSFDAVTPNLSLLSQGNYQGEGFLYVTSAGNFQLPGVVVAGVDVSGFTVHLEAGYHAVTGSPPEGSVLYHYTNPFGVFMRRPMPSYLGTFPPEESVAIPALLSETGAFADLASLEIADGLIPFEPNAKLWSDGAEKFRWIALPAGTSIGFSETGAWTFPPGTVLIKHFEIGSDKHRIETRFEIVKEGGSSYLVTYRWREDQSEADLVGPEGAQGMVGDLQWFFPSRAQCVACHNSSVNYVLGASTRQLNGDYLYPSGHNDSQLRTWNHLEMFDVEAPAGLSALSGLADTGASLEQRVRSYLDANCAFCHNSVAAPEGTNFVLEYDTPIEQSNVIGGTTTRPLDLGTAARIIAPRDPRHSVLYKRVAGNEVETRMPPIGRTVIHAEAREALVEWILSLPPANTVVDVTDYTRRWDFDGQTGDGVWRDLNEMPSYATGKLGQALAFDGVDDAVDLGPLDVPSSTGLTISFWFKADDFGTSDARFLSKADGQFDDDHYWMISTLNETKLRFRLKAGGVTTNLVSASGTLSTGVWTHVAARYDGVEMTLFKNGVEVASQLKSGALDANGTVDAAIGNQPTTASGGPRPFDGLIDDMRIYPRALTESEILIVRDAGGTPNTEPALQITPPGATYLTRADVANLSAAATDPEDGALGVTWLSTTEGDVTLNTLSDGAHTLVASARDSNGSADSGLVRVHVVPGFEGWAADRGVLADPLLDDDGNDLTLLEEYAYGDEFLSPDMSLDDTTGKMTLSFSVNPLAIDVRFQSMFGNSLDDFTVEEEWIPMGDSISGPEATVDGLEIHAPSPLGYFQRMFGRIQVVKP